MSHQEKQRIFDEYAKSQDLEKVRLGNTPIEVTDWEDVLIAFRYSKISLQTITELIFTACDLVQEEQQKRIAENAKIQKESCGDSMTCGCMGRCDYPVSYINKKSIINPENKIQ